MPGGFGSTGFGSTPGGQIILPPFTPVEPAVYEPWPSTLPSWVRQEDYREDEPNVVIRQVMDSGVAKQRPRFTSGALPFVMSISVTWEQVEIFEEFYRNTLKDGALPFAWINHRTGDPTGYRFPADAQGPEIIPDGHEFIIRMILEEVP